MTPMQSEHDQRERGGGSERERGVRRWALAAIALGTAAALGALAIACGDDGQAAPDAGTTDAGAPPAPCDIDAFTGVGTACTAASPTVCFPMCDAGGCSCLATPEGPRWSCVTDTSCLPSCGPLDDGCASDASSE